MGFVQSDLDPGDRALGLLAERVREDLRAHPERDRLRQDLGRRIAAAELGDLIEMR